MADGFEGQEDFRGRNIFGAKYPKPLNAEVAEHTEASGTPVLRD